MYRFTYNRGQWADGCDLPDWTDNEEFPAYIRRIGYSTSRLCIGSEHGSCIELYESSNGGSFYASIAPMGGTCYEVLLTDFPSLMLFLKEFSAAFSLLNTDGEQHEILSVLEKLFRVYHGHATHELCEQCDPQGWEANLKHREARARSKSESV